MINKLTEKPVRWLTLGVCEELYQEFKDISKLEPLPPFYTRYEGRLEDIIGSVMQTWDGELLNSTILDASSAYFNKFVRSQCLMNGNKRMGVLYTHYFLLTNGVDFTLDYKELFNFAARISVASEQGIKDHKTLEWCKKVISEFTKEL